jgi:glycosyltransferase involved in cell wall biosynthesis
MNLGGPAQQASLLSGRRFDPERYETLLVHGELAAGDQSMADLAEREGARTNHLPTLVQPVRPWRDARALAAIARIARRFRPDIVHTHMAKAGFLGRSAALLRVCPRPVLVHTFHGQVLEGYFGPLKSTVYRQLERQIGRSSDCLIGVSQATVDDLVRLGVAPQERFRVIPLGLDLEPFADPKREAGSELRRELGVSDDEVLFSYVGRVVPIKRLDVLLRGFSRARADGARVRLVIVGDGETRPDLERLAGELGITSAVSFLGYRRDLPKVAASADAAVLSSDNEGTPVSLIEAAAAGRPAVATAVGGIPEVVVPDSGILVPARDEVALAAAMIRLARDPELRLRMGQRGQQHVLRHYSGERLLADVDSLYRELLEVRHVWRPARALADG